MTFKYIVSNPEILGGKPAIKGTRISVQLILESLSHGEKEDEIVSEFPQITIEAIRECLWYASKLVSIDTSYEIEIASVA